MPKWSDKWTRQVWIPYTGTPPPTYGTLEQALSQFASAGTIRDEYITDVGGAQIDVAGGTGWVRADDTDVSNLLSFDWDAQAAIDIPTDTIRYVGIIYAGGLPIVDVRVADVWDDHTEFRLGSVVNEGDLLYILNNPQVSVDAPGKIFHRFYETMPLQRADRLGGLIIGAVGVSQIFLSEGELYDGLNEFVITEKNTSIASTFDYYYRDGGVGFTRVAAQTDWDDTNYDDGTGVLDPMNNNWYKNVWVYVEADDQLVCMYGQGEYPTAAAAENEGPPPNVPDRLLVQGRLVGRFVVQEGAAGASVTDSAFEVDFGPAAVTAHSLLSGLIAPADDHTQYILVAGTRAFTGNQSMGTNNLTDIGRADAAAGSDAAPSYSFTGNLNCGMYSGGANIVRFSTNSIERLEIELDGTLNVGATADYEDLVLADDDIPNRKFTVDAIADATFWDRAVTTLSPTTAGDTIDINAVGVGISLGADTASDFTVAAASLTLACTGANGDMLINTSESNTITYATSAVGSFILNRSGVTDLLTCNNVGNVAWTPTATQDFTVTASGAGGDVTLDSNAGATTLQQGGADKVACLATGAILCSPANNTNFTVTTIGTGIVSLTSATGISLTGITAAGISLDAVNASNFTVDNNTLLLSTTTAGTLSITSAGIVAITSGNAADIDLIPANDVEIYLPDDAGANRFVIYDSEGPNVVFSVNSDGEALTSNGLSGAPSWSFLSDPDTGAYSVGADEYGISAGNSLKLQLGTNATYTNITAYSVTTAGAITLTSGGGTDITMHSDNDVVVILGDAAGADAFQVQDSGPVTVASIDSNGVGLFGSGLVGGPGISFIGDATSGLYLSAVGTIRIAAAGINTAIFTATDQTIKAGAGGDIVLRLGDAVGATDLRIQNSAVGIAARINSNGVVTAGNGAVGGPSYSFTSDPNTGMWGDGADSIYFSTNATERFHIEPDGTLNVSGTTDYELLVTDDDDIPNKKYVDDEIAGSAGSMTTLLSQHDSQSWGACGPFDSAIAITSSGLWAGLGTLDATSTDDEGADGPYFNQGTGAVNNAEALIQSTGTGSFYSHRMGWSSRCRARIQIDDTVTMRLFIGFINTRYTGTGSADEPLAGDDPANERAGISYSTSRGDGNWQWTSRGTGAEVLTNTGIAISTDTVEVEVILDESVPNITFNLYDEAGALLDTATHAVGTSLPQATTNLQFFSGVRTLAVADCHIYQYGAGGGNYAV